MFYHHTLWNTRYYGYGVTTPTSAPAKYDFTTTWQRLRPSGSPRWPQNSGFLLRSYFLTVVFRGSPSVSTATLVTWPMSPMKMKPSTLPHNGPMHPSLSMLRYSLVGWIMSINIVCIVWYTSIKMTSFHIIELCRVWRHFYLHWLVTERVLATDRLC